MASCDLDGLLLLLGVRGGDWERGGSEGLRDCVYVGVRVWMQGRGRIE